MKTRLLTLIALASALAFSCAKEPELEEKKEQESELPASEADKMYFITKEIESFRNQNGTKVGLDGVNTIFNKGDRISVFGDGHYGQKRVSVFTAMIDGQPNKFEGYVKGYEQTTKGRYFIAYPSCIKAYINSTPKLVFLPFSVFQTGVRDGMPLIAGHPVSTLDGQAADILYAVAKTDTISMKHLISLLRFQISGSDVTEVSLSMEGKTLTCFYTVVESLTNSLPTIKPYGGYGECGTVVIRPSGETFEPGTYYAAVLAPGGSQALTYALKNRDGRILTGKGNTFQPNRAMIHNAAPKALDAAGAWEASAPKTITYDFSKGASGVFFDVSGNEKKIPSSNTTNGSYYIKDSDGELRYTELSAKSSGFRSTTISGRNCLYMSSETDKKTNLSMITVPAIPGYTFAGAEVSFVSPNGTERIYCGSGDIATNTLNEEKARVQDGKATMQTQLVAPGSRYKLVFQSVTSSEGGTYNSGYCISKVVLSYSPILSGIPDFPHDDGKVSADVDSRAAALKAEILDSPNGTFSASKTYYVSSSSGKDSNSGLSEQSPIRSIAKLASLSLSSGTVVRFKRGDTFRGHIVCKSGVTYTSYGSGGKPKIYGSPWDGAKEGKWTATDAPDVYVYSNTTGNDVGTLIFDNGEKGCAYKVMKYIGTDEVPYSTGSGREFNSYRDLDRDLDMWHDLSNGKIYLCSRSGNPASRFNSIEFNTKEYIFKLDNVDNVTIDNLCIKYTGAHGIGTANTVRNMKVTNCEIGWIGGSIHHENAGTDTSPTRYGNGVEVYGACYGYIIDRCWVYQVYDAAVTFQFTSKKSDFRMKDITFSNNLIEDSVYGIEYFLTPDNDSVDPGFIENVDLCGNIIRRTGYGWGMQRPDTTSPAALKGWKNNSSVNFYKNARTGFFRVRDNIFDRGIPQLLDVQAGRDEYLPDFSGNLYIQTSDMAIGSMREKNPEVVIK